METKSKLLHRDLYQPTKQKGDSGGGGGGHMNKGPLNEQTDRHTDGRTAWGTTYVVEAQRVNLPNIHLGVVTTKSQKRKVFEKSPELKITTM